MHGLSGRHEDAQSTRVCEYKPRESRLLGFDLCERGHVCIHETTLDHVLASFDEYEMRYDDIVLYSGTMNYVSSHAPSHTRLRPMNADCMT